MLSHDEATMDIGEELCVFERVIVAPAVGVFRPLPPETYTTEGEIVSEGQSIGTITALHAELPVRSTIHASSVSRRASRSALVSRPSGMATPQPVIVAFIGTSTTPRAGLRGRARRRPRACPSGSP